jgi:hypothetical protein
MGLDASIPLQGLLINRNDENLKKQRLQMGQLEMQRYQQEGERRKRLGDLLPGAAKGDQAAIDEAEANRQGQGGRPIERGSMGRYS